MFSVWKYAIHQQDKISSSRRLLHHLLHHLLRHLLRPVFFSTVLPAFLLAAQPAQATWTVIAVDPATGEVGAAGATCSPFVSFVLATAPQHGVVVAQGATSFEARDRIRDALFAEKPAQIALDEELGNADADRDFRQYGVISMIPDGDAFLVETATFTGTGLDDTKGTVGDIDFSVQGNILASSAVLDEAARAYQGARDAGLPLAERLLLALEAGAAQGGDRRCSPERAAESSFLVVERGFVTDPSLENSEDNDLPLVDIRIDATWFGEPAVQVLRQRFDEQQNPNGGCQSVSSSSFAWSVFALGAGLQLLRTRKRAHASSLRSIHVRPRQSHQPHSS